MNVPVGSVANSNQKIITDKLAFWLEGNFPVSYPGTGDLWYNVTGGTALFSYVDEIILTGAGTTTSDGTYTRSSGGSTQFDGPNGNYIYTDGGSWYLYDATFGSDTYIAYSYTDFSLWYVNAGDFPEPSATVNTFSSELPAACYFQNVMPAFSTNNQGYFDFFGTSGELYGGYGYIYSISSAFSFGTNPFSIELWAYLYEPTFGYFKTICSIGYYYDGILFRHQPENDAFYIAGTAWDWNAETHMPPYTWKHLVISKEGSNVKIYVNGVLVLSETNAPLDVSPPVPDSHLAASSHNTSELWPGYIASYKVYNGKALTSDEVLNNFNVTKYRFNV